jgi:hypothetical protein
MTAIEKAIDLIHKDYEVNGRLRLAYVSIVLGQAKNEEKVKEAKRLLFLGKVSQVIGFDKTAELLKEVEKEIKKGI